MDWHVDGHRGQLYSYVIALPGHDKGHSMHTTLKFCFRLFGIVLRAVRMLLRLWLLHQLITLGRQWSRLTTL